jgi:hypothetical protein
MLPFALAAFALFCVDPSIAQQNVREIAQARAAVAEMIRLAVTPDERSLAMHDREIVEGAAEILSNRDNQSQGTRGMAAANESQGLGVGCAAKSDGRQGSGAIGAAAGGDSQGQLLAATKQMQETQMSFNLQYLQLQSQMQDENRSYTAISNIMKTKHDTVKNSISNIR